MKNKYFSKIFLILFYLFLASCAGPVNVNIRPDSTFNSQSSITVADYGGDYLGVQAELESILMSYGFNVISIAATGDVVRYEGESLSSDNQTKSKASLRVVREVPSVFILRFNYNGGHDAFLGDYFIRFTATLVNLSNGKIVASARFSQSDLPTKRASTVLEKFVGKLSDSIQ